MSADDEAEVARLEAKARATLKAAGVKAPATITAAAAGYTVELRIIYDDIEHHFVLPSPGAARALARKIEAEAGKADFGPLPPKRPETAA